MLEHNFKEDWKLEDFVKNNRNKEGKNSPKNRKIKIAHL